MYKSIQGCRALASLFVVLHHLGTAVASDKYFGVSQFAEPFRFGDSGVEFFFVLSGFIITWVHFHDFGRPRALWKYLRKRATRIYPTYLLVFGIVYVLALASPTLRSTLPHDFATTIKSLALWPQDSSVVGGSGAPVLIVAWSLQYEVCFYALIAVFIVSPAIGLLICVPLSANFLACHVGAGCAFPRGFFANNLVLLFGIGALIAYCAKKPWRMRRPAIIAAIAAAAFLCFAFLETLWGQDTFTVDRRLVYGFLSGIVIFSLIQAEDSRQIQINNRWLPLLGDSSYVLYLIHYPLISVLCKVLFFLGLRGIVGASIACPVILFACVLAALTFHIWIENPMLKTLAGTRRSIPDKVPLAHG